MLPAIALQFVLNHQFVVRSVLYLHVEAVLQLAASRGRRQDLSAGSLVSFPHPASTVPPPFCPPIFLHLSVVLIAY